MTYIAKLATIACMLATVIATGAQAAGTEETKLSATAIAQRFKARFASQCQPEQAPPRSASATEAQQPAAARAFAQTQASRCECMPREIDAWVGRVGGDSLFTTAEILEVGLRITRTCNAHGLRTMMNSACAAGLDPLARPDEPPVSEERRQSRCSCMQAGIAKLDDEQITQTSQSIYRDHAAKTKARREGAAEPAPSLSPRMEVEQACRAQDAQR